MSPIVVIGAGGHAKVVIEALRAAGGFNIIGVVDPKRPETNEVLGVPWLGSDEALKKLRVEGVGSAFVAIGDNGLRQRISLSLLNCEFEMPVVMHPTAQVSPSAVIGRGSIVMARACIGPVAVIGELAVINTGAIIEHDDFIGDAAHVAPGTALGGSVHVGARTLVGIGVSIRPGVVLGDDIIVGAGSSVIEDFPSGVTIAGVPARRLRSVTGE